MFKILSLFLSLALAGSGVASLSSPSVQTGANADLQTSANVKAQHSANVENSLDLFLRANGSSDIDAGANTDANVDPKSLDPAQAAMAKLPKDVQEKLKSIKEKKFR